MSLESPALASGFFTTSATRGAIYNPGHMKPFFFFFLIPISEGIRSDVSTKQEKFY